jgi:enoyl-CoA hydratase/carnithine racemase
MALVPKQRSVLIEQEATLGRVVLNRPAARNPMDRATAEGILIGLRRHFSDSKIRSVVITGNGDAFCAGGDLGQMRNLNSLSSTDVFEWSAPIVEAQKLMLKADKPVIAAVNGPAHAGGMGLAAMCDVVVAVRSATFALPEVRIGLFPMIVIAQLVRSLPRKWLLEMMLTGEPIDATVAHAIGFVNRVVDDVAQLGECVRGYAAMFEQVSPNAIRMGRRAFNLMADMTAEQALEAAQFLNVPFMLGQDFTEGARAFFEKRAPVWSRDDKTGSRT